MTAVVRAQPPLDLEKAWGGGTWWRSMFLFFAQPVLFGCWVVFIPQIKDTLNVNFTDIALGLLGLPIGLLCMLPLADKLIHLIGARAGLLIGFPLQAVAMFLVSQVTTLPQFFVVLFFGGCTLAFTEISMNLCASFYERATNKPIMSRAHGCWSVGLTLGGQFGVLMHYFEVPLSWTLVAAIVLVYSAAIYIILQLERENFLEVEAAEGEKKSSSFFRPPLLLVGLAFFSIPLLVAEGAVTDWSALYSRELLEPGSNLAGQGFVLYAAFHAAGRFSGDWLKGRIGTLRLVRILGVLCLVGSVLIIATTNIVVVFVGFALLGVGSSAGYPLAMSAAARLPGKTSSHVAFLSFVSFSGFLLGPPLLGFVADLYSLRVSFGLLLPLLVVSLLLTGTLRSR